MMKSLFNLPDNVSYLNNAYMAPQLKSISQVGQEYLLQKERPFTISPDDFFTDIDKLKALFAQLIDLEDPQGVAIAPSASYALANAANNIPLEKGDEILLMEEQFPSNVYCWMERAKRVGAIIKFVGKPQEEDKDWSDAVLEQINEKTKVVAMGHVHWADGYLFDLKKIRKALDVYGAYLVIDGTQSVGALAFSVKDIQPDVLVVSAYKWLLGPYGICLSYFGPRLHAGDPIEYSWMNRKDAEDFSNLVSYQDEYRTAANRYCMGQSSSFIYVSMLSEGLRHLLDWGTDRIQKHGLSLQKEARAALANDNLSLSFEGKTAAHLWSVKISDKVNLSEMAARIKAENIFLSVRGNYARISCHLYNDSNDIKRLITLLNSL